MPALTGLRGIAAAWVVLFHVFGSGVFFVGNGYAGVDVFFVLSGFILMHVYLKDDTLYSVQGYCRFLLLRLARVYPLHLFCLLVLLLLVCTVPGYRTVAAATAHHRDLFTYSGFIASLLLVQDWIPGLGDGWNTPSWSLSAEWLAYLFFPFIVFQIRKVPGRRLLIGYGMVLMAMLAGVLFFTGHPTSDAVGLSGILRMMMEFPAGCLMYLAFERNVVLPQRFVLGTCLGLLMASFVFPKIELVTLFAFPLLVLSAAQGRVRVLNLLCWTPIVFLGDISFSIYLTHQIVIRLVGGVHGAGLDQRVLVNWGIIGAILLVSVVTHRCVEKPARRFGRMLAQQGIFLKRPRRLEPEES